MAPGIPPTPRVEIGAWRHRFEATGGREPTAGRVLVVAVLS